MTDAPHARTVAPQDGSAAEKGQPAHTDQLPEAVPAPDAKAPALVRVVHSLENAGALDRLARPMAWLSRPTGEQPLSRLLTGEPLGHALHPALTDAPLGLWSSSMLLDLVGGKDKRSASQLLLAAGLVSAVPTAMTGLAEWRRTARPESRVASLHAVLNSAALVLYAASLAARRRGRHEAGVAMSLAGTGVSVASAFLGGHLTTARKTGSRHPAYLRDGVGPSLERTNGPQVDWAT